MHFKIGDSVKVKPGIMDPDSKIDLSGYQGRIVEKETSDLYSIRWDSLTLKQLPHAYIKEAEQQGFAWDIYNLEASDFELTTPRDTKKEAEQVFFALHSQVYWVNFGEAGERIDAVLSGIPPQDDSACLHAWHNHLIGKLSFPFQAKIAEWQEADGPLQCDDAVVVHRIVQTELGTEYGLFAEIRHPVTQTLFPLVELEVADPLSQNYIPVQDYVLWFSNK